MRSRKTIPQKYVVERYGRGKGIKVNYKGSGIFREDFFVYYYRINGVWYPSTKENLVKRGIIK